jgi:hypothetical protein
MIKVILEHDMTKSGHANNISTATTTKATCTEIMMMMIMIHRNYDVDVNLIKQEGR